MDQPAIAVQKLVTFQHRNLLRHLLGLAPEDRRLRFGVPASDEGIARYVRDIDFSRDKVFGIFEPGLALSGAAHLALDAGSGTAELGLSVDPARRGQGYGYALLIRGKLHAQNLGYRSLYMHCLAENRIMIHLARKAGMKVVTESGESDAHVALSEATYGDLAREMVGDQIALIDYLLKQHTRWLR